MANNVMKEKLMQHVGHQISCVYYGEKENPADVCIECEDCNEVLYSAEDAETDEEAEPKQVIAGDYVLSPCKNAFNDKTSYWISKKGYAVAYYAFTPLDDEDLKRQLAENSIEGYIRMYEEMEEH